MAQQQSSSKKPLEIARETFKQLASKRITPTPDNYERIYHELAGTQKPANFEDAFSEALSGLKHDSAAQIKWAKSWQQCLKEEGWPTLASTLQQGMDLSIQTSQTWPVAIRELLKSWTEKQVGLTTTQKTKALDTVLKNFGQDALLAEKLNNLANNWSSHQSVDESHAIDVLEGDDDASVSSVDMPLVSDSPNTPSTSLKAADNDNGVFNRTPDPFQQSFNELKEVLRQSIKYGFLPRLDGYPELQESAQEINFLAEKAKTMEDWQEMIKAFRALIVKVELIGASEVGVKNDLLRMLKLLVDNVGELVEEDAWLRGQVATIQTIIVSPLDRATLIEAEQSLKEVIYKQGLLKNSLDEAKETFKKMIATFIERLSHMAESTGDYADVISNVSTKIAETDDMIAIHQAVEELMQTSNTMQTDILRSRDDLLEQSAEFDEAQAKIKLLESELTSLSEQVRVDQLTGVLNRRGMDEAFKQEIARADRSGQPLSVSLLDIDNFKQLNDNYGHDVGDEALKHLANVVKSTVRPTDVVTRFGGEEFVILLPDTQLSEGAAFLLRVQRELTKQFFMANKSQLVITFSAGVALYRHGEAAAELLHRADQSMYLAKKTGKNKAMTEEDLMVKTQSDLSD